MKIWFFSAYDQPKGMSSRTYDFTKNLVKRGHEVTFFTNSYCHWKSEEKLDPKEKYRIENIDGIRVVWMRTINYRSSFMRFLNMISNFIKSLTISKKIQSKPDCILGPSVPITTGLAAYLVAKREEAPFVYEIRDVWPEALLNNGTLSKYNPLYFLFSRIEKILYEKADAISSVLPFVSGHVNKKGGSSDKVTWIPNCANLDIKPDFQNKKFINSDFLNVIYIGGYGHSHDPLTIVEAANILKKANNHNFRFTFIGDGPLRKKCEELIKYYDLDNFEFKNSIVKAEIPEALKEADITIASIFDKPIYKYGVNMNKIYDYLSAGKPIIFSGKVPNDPVKESGCGFSLAPSSPPLMADTLDKISFLSKEELNKLGLRGFNYAKENFHIENLTSKMEQLFLSLR